MNYIVFDLEWNQAPDGKESREKDFPFEIIEIGAIKLDDNRVCTDEFYKIIKPQVYGEMNAHIKEIIHMDMEDLQSGVIFQEALKEFLEWCGEDYIFCTWGSMDLYELQRNMEYYSMSPLAEKPFVYLDVQKLFSIQIEDRKKTYALERAVDLLDIKKEDAFHNALTDAKYTAQVLQLLKYNIVNMYVSVDTYHYPNSRKDEMYLRFDKYSKYISRRFSSKESAFSDYYISGMKCLVCGRNLRKKIRWFSNNKKTYLCTAYCDKHGYMKGKVQVRKAEKDGVYVIKIIKSTTNQETLEIKEKYNMLRLKRRLKRSSR